MKRHYGLLDARDNARSLLLGSDSLLRDDLDRQIVAHLVNNARASYGEIGQRVGLSAPAVKRRVDRLLAEGVITGFSARLDDEAIGATTEAFVELYCRSRTNPADIAEMVADLPDVVEAYTVTGEADALLHVKTGSPAELEAVVEQVRAHQNAERTKTTIVLSRIVARASGS
jgi:DNA-binding Lrp family transcriptional regulator